MFKLFFKLKVPLLLVGLTSAVFGNEDLLVKELLESVGKSRLTKKVSQQSFVEEEKAHYKGYFREIQRAEKLENRCNAVLVTWFFAEDVDSLELVWWRSEDRSIRTLIVAIYLAMRLEPISSVPPFEGYANGFADKEKKQRLEEIDWAENLDNRKLIAKHIGDWAKRNLNVDKKDEFVLFKLKSYKQMASKK